VQLRVGDSPLLARITARSRRELEIAPGSEVWVQIKGVALLA
jgi:molybdate transport system ATP-binding protein